MTESLDKLKHLYLGMPKFEDDTDEDLRKIFTKYIPILAFIATNENLRISISGLTDRVDDIDILISAVNTSNSIQDREIFFKKATAILRADIKSLIVIIEKL